MFCLVSGVVFQVGLVDWSADCSIRRPLRILLLIGFDALIEFVRLAAGFAQPLIVPAFFAVFACFLFDLSLVCLSFGWWSVGWVWVDWLVSDVLPWFWWVNRFLRLFY